MNEILTVALIFGLITLIPSLLSNLVTRMRPLEFLDDEDKDEEFRVMWWFYPLNCGLLLIAAMFVFAGTIYFRFYYGNMIVIGIGLFFFTLCIVNFFRLPRIRIIFTQGKFIYNNGFKIKVEVHLNEIKSVRIFHGNICINDGNKFDKVVPIYFQDVSRIIAKLKRYTFKNSFD